MIRDLTGGYQLDDDASRINPLTLSQLLRSTIWASKITTAESTSKIIQADRAVGLYHSSKLVGFARVIVEHRTRIALLLDVIVHSDHRGKGLGEALVRFTIDGGQYAGWKWFLETIDSQSLYERLGFTTGSAMVRRRA